MAEKCVDCGKEMQDGDGSLCTDDKLRCNECDLKWLVKGK